MDKRRRTGIIVVLAAAAALVLGAGAGTARAGGDDPAATAKVKVWEEASVLPTWQVGKPEPNPRFYDGRVYQGAQGRVYPYVMLDRLTDVRKPQAWKRAWLENEYVKVSLLPEIGGRVFSALDKTDDYEMIYHQHAVKPGLIGMLGAWITGGIEWNVFHHHRATSFMPVDYKLVENPDGSATVWVGEMDLRHRMRWTIGVSVRPGRSYFEADVRLINRTPFVNSILYFANTGVHSNDDYQVMFPPRTRFVTQHAKAEYAGWPIAREYYGNVDFSQGVDISWWKNNPYQISFFCWNYDDDFEGGYDHGKDAGILIVADHSVAQGKKFWTWGNGPRGRLWDSLLTETDGPELEIMAGAFSDNQPDYSWIQPGEFKTVKQYWYPIRGLKGVKNATIEGALNLEVAGGTAKVGFNTTSRRDGARARLTAAGKVVWEQAIDIAPDKPFLKDVTLPAGVAETDLRLSLTSREGEELVAWQPLAKGPADFPPTAQPPADPADMKTVEELYLAGTRLEQFHHPTWDPVPYYREALRRDPGDARTNTAMGLLALRQGRFEDADRHLTAAVNRLTWNYTKSRDGEAQYYRGVVRRFLGRPDEAAVDFAASAWSRGFHAPARLQLAELEARQGRWASALAHCDGTLSVNGDNPRAWNLRAAVLRKLGRFDDAVASAARALAIDPLDMWAENETALALGAAGKAAEAGRAAAGLAAKMRDEVQSYLELAVDYGAAGMLDEALQVLDRARASKTPALAKHPEVTYYAAFYRGLRGEESAAGELRLQASRLPHEYCFPFRLESIAVLNAAIRANPADAMAPYYLGNLLFDLNPEEAVKAWEESIRRGANFATLHRNLGYGIERVRKDLPAAIARYEKAVSLDKSDQRLFYELDLLYEKAQAPLKKRLAVLQGNHKAIAAAEVKLALEREAMVLALLGRYDEAVAVARSTHFRRWEGGENVYTTFVDANLLQGRAHMRAGRYARALRYFQAAAENPANLEISELYSGGRAAETFYALGTAYEALGDRDKAKESYERAAGWRQRPALSEIYFFRAMALKKLGRADEAAKIFDGLVELGGQRLVTRPKYDFFAKFGQLESDEVRMAAAHYLIGLGKLGREDAAGARAEFEAAAKLNLNHIWARGRLLDLD